MTHENWKLSYAGVDLPPPIQGGFAPTFEPIDEAGRNLNGDMFIEIVAHKRTITVSWDNLTGTQVTTIIRTCRNNRTGTLSFFDISLNDHVSMRAYYAPITTAKLHRYDDDPEKQLWKGLSVKFVEM